MSDSSGGGAGAPVNDTNLELDSKGMDEQNQARNDTMGNGSLYSDRVKVTIARSERLKRNVLEINLESEAEADKIDKEMMAKLFKTMGFRKEELEGYQLSGKRKLFVWFKVDVDLSKYCRDECFRVAPGVKTALIKPMDNKEVIVTIKGININTPDTLVFSYLSHFGKLVSQKVLYDTEKDGPLEGLKNGDRKFKMDFSGGRDMGTFHLVDGANVIVSYAGQRKTCGRCHGDSRSCPGGGWARSCDQKGGSRVELRDHMRQLWSNIGFNPDKFESDRASDDAADLDVLSFTPPARVAVSETAKAKFSGVYIRNFPRDMSLTDMQTLLEDKGLPVGHDKISILKYKRSVGADIEDLPADICMKLIEAVNDQFIETLDRKLYCSGVSDLVTPEKPSHSAPVLNILASSNIPGLPEAERKKIEVKPRKPNRQVNVMATPGVGKNSREGLDISSSDEESDTDSCHSKTTKSKIKQYQDLVQKEKLAAASQRLANKRGPDQLSPHEVSRRQKMKEGSTSSM